MGAEAARSAPQSAPHPSPSGTIAHAPRHNVSQARPSSTQERTLRTSPHRPTPLAQSGFSPVNSTDDQPCPAQLSLGASSQWETEGFFSFLPELTFLA